MENICADDEVATHNAHDNLIAAEMDIDLDDGVEAKSSELLGIEVESDKEAYELYNNYAYRKGFSVRKGKFRRLADKVTISMRQFVCSYEGFKATSATPKAYNKSNTRTGCKAFVQFDVDKSGVYSCVRHDMVHNHKMVPPDKRHWLRSHRDIEPEQLSFISSLKDSGIPVSDAIRHIRKEVGGQEALNFTPRDVYNALDKQKKENIDGCDTNQLIKMFKQRQAEEYDFYYDFEVDDEGHIVNFFWRDWIMRRDYDTFGDLLVHDTTYRTNRYNMICGPFVGMNHHSKNIMFGVGFILNEKTESFIWLFNSFLRSMGGKVPITVMTDQSAAMAAAIRIVFPSSKHRLCIWHIGQNAKKKIRGLRKKKGFKNLFNYVLKYTDTVAEFEHYWSRMEEKYNCADNKWLRRLYSVKEKWCPAYSKEYFSGEILSSQRSETTNKSVSKRLHKTHGLCDFYREFLDVVEEWRDKENGEDFQCWVGNRHLAFASVKLLIHARELYTIELYLTFEESFIKGAACNQKIFSYEPPILVYHVWRPDQDFIRHVVTFNMEEGMVSCTCNGFTESGFLCAHSLRILHIHCVETLPSRYIVSRWTKSVMSTVATNEGGNDSSVVSSFVWRTQTIRNFIRLVTSSQNDIAAQKVVNSAYDDMKKEVEKLLSSNDVMEEEEDKDDDTPSHSSDYVKDPTTSKEKYVRNDRLKSTMEKECNKYKGWKKRQQKFIDETKAKAQASVQGKDEIPPGGNLAHPTSHDLGLELFVPDDYFGVNYIPFTSP